MEKYRIIIMSVILLVLSACDNSETEDESTTESSESGWSPEETVEVIVPFGPGGGTDLYIREIMDIMQNEGIIDQDVTVENREGGSGATGYSFLSSQEGNPHYVGPTAASFFATPQVSDAGYEVEDFTPIALMGADDLFLLVDGNSEIDSLDEFIETAQDETLRIGGVGQVSDERIVPSQFAEEADFNFEYVPFQGAGELTSALTSESLDAIMGNPTRAMGQIESGMFKPLAFSGQERYAGASDIPTFIEEGYDVNLSQPRGVILPGGVDDEAREWWINAMQEVTETDEWKQFVEDNGLSDYFLFGEEFEEFLLETNEAFSDSVDELDTQ